MSETSRCRSRLKQYCSGVCIDIGCGGDPIIPEAIAMDLPQPYNIAGDSPIQLGGDCRDLYWFRDGVIDSIYSSHLIEDFEESTQIAILNEWLRVLRPGGTIILYLPDQVRYITHCETYNQPMNPYHSIPDYSLEWFLDHIIPHLDGVNIIHSDPAVEDYSFEIILQKKLI